MPKFNILLLAGIFCAPLAAKNLIPDPGFEKKDSLEKNWRFSSSHGKEVFSILDHNGRSLHLKDERKDNTNSSLFHIVSWRHLPSLKGKKVLFSAKIKPVSASSPKQVGISLSAETSDGKKILKQAGIDPQKMNQWQTVSVSMRLPETTGVLFCYLNCSSGWGETGEAFFDELKLTLEPDGTKASFQNPVSLVSFLPVPHDWKTRTWGGYSLKGQELRYPKGGRAYGGLQFQVMQANAHFDCSAIPANRLALRIVLEKNLPLTVKLFSGGKGAERKIAGGTADGTENFRYLLPMETFGMAKAPSMLEKILLQISEAQTPGNCMIREIALVSDGPGTVRRVEPPELEPIRAYYLNYPQFREDNRKRPEICNGTWFIDNRYEFYSGPWIKRMSGRDWGPGKNVLNIQHPAYTEPPTANLFEKLRFNSAQVSSAPYLPQMLLYGLPAEANFKFQEEDAAEYYRGLKDTPLVVDFAFAFSGAVRKQRPELWHELQQQHSGWHSFIPVCPEHPEGRRYYRASFAGGTAAVLHHGGNVFTYELFNESNYNCRCKFNLADFARRMERKYQTIGKANRLWNTSFHSFSDLRNMPKNKFPAGLCNDWCDFSATRYVEVLKEGIDAVRSVDRRDRVYFTEQLSNVNVYTTDGSGMDYRKIAAALDVLSIEGGWKYGTLEPLERKSLMEEAASEENCAYSFVCDLFQKLAENKKPILNNEHYCARFEFGKRVPSRRTDMITSFWGEIFHGLSGSFIYSWDKRSWDWNTLEEAKENVINGGYKAYCFVNPYNWPPSELDAFAIFRRELEPYRDLLLPQPRFRKATVGIFFSYPSLRMTGNSRENFKLKMMNAYSALLYGHYPLTFLFEEDLKNPPKEIKAILLPVASHTDRETAENLQRYLNAGGIVIADRKAFAKDLYGSPSAWRPKGIHTVDMAKKSAAAQIRALLRSVPRHGWVTPEDGKPLELTDLQIIDRGSRKMIFLCSMEHLHPRLVRLHLNTEDRGEFYLSDVVTGRWLAGPERETWNADELKRGVQYVLPPQERVLLLLERKRPANAETLSQATMQKYFQDVQKRCKPEILAFQKRREAFRKVYEEARNFRGVRPERCKPVDLRNAVNMAFSDDVPGDKKGGWFDQGNNDFSNMPLGRITAAGVPFEIIDPARNGNRSVVILNSSDNKLTTGGVYGIPVGEKVKYLYVLHTMGWYAGHKEPVIRYILHYADGTKTEFAARCGFEINDWWGTPVLRNAKIAVETSNAHTSKINMQCARWLNPHPGKTVLKLDIVSAGSNGVPAVAAVTLEKPD